MASRKVNEAVEMYREIQWLEFKIEQVNDRLLENVNRLSQKEMSDYVDMTSDLDEKVSDAVLYCDANRLAESTTKQYVRRAMLAAGHK